MPLPLFTSVGKELLLFIKVLPPHSMALFDEATGLAFFPGIEPLLKVSVRLPTFMPSSCPPSFKESSVVLPHPGGQICLTFAVFPLLLPPAELLQHSATVRMEQRVNEVEAS